MDKPRHEDLSGLKQIEQEADDLYGTWRRYLETWGTKDSYWSRIIELSDDFANRHGKYGSAVITARVQLLEHKWREYLGIVYSGTMEGMEETEIKMPIEQEGETA